MKNFLGNSRSGVKIALCSCSVGLEVCEQLVLVMEGNGLCLPCNIFGEAKAPMFPSALPFFPATQNYHFWKVGSSRVTLTQTDVGSLGYLLKVLVAVTKKIKWQEKMNQFIFKLLRKVSLFACERDQDLKFKICLKFNLDKFMIVGGSNLRMLSVSLIKRKH